MPKNEVTKTQTLYEKVQALKTDRASKKRERREGLEAIPRYMELQEEAGKLREQKKTIVAGFDESNEQLVNDIESLDKKIETAEYALTTSIMEDIRDGREISVFKMTSAGERKKLTLELKTKFLQPSLGL